MNSNFLKSNINKSSQSNFELGNKTAGLLLYHTVTNVKSFCDFLTDFLKSFKVVSQTSRNSELLLQLRTSLTVSLKHYLLTPIVKVEQETSCFILEDGITLQLCAMLRSSTAEPQQQSEKI